MRDSAVCASGAGTLERNQYRAGLLLSSAVWATVRFPLAFRALSAYRQGHRHGCRQYDKERKHTHGTDDHDWHEYPPT